MSKQFSKKLNEIALQDGVGIPVGCDCGVCGVDPRAAEVEQVKAVALDVVTRAMKEGEASHAVGEWRTESVGDRLGHVMDHIRAWVQGGEIGELEHALTGLALVLTNLADSAQAEAEE